MEISDFFMTLCLMVMTLIAFIAFLFLAGEFIECCVNWTPSIQAERAGYNLKIDHAKFHLDRGYTARCAYCESKAVQCKVHNEK